MNNTLYPEKKDVKFSYYLFYALRIEFQTLSVSTVTLFYILCILLLIFFYMFRA